MLRHVVNSAQSNERAAIHWFDATSILRLRNRLPVGLTRVEAHVVQGALNLPSATSAFGRYNQYTRSFDFLERSTIEKLLASYGAEATSISRSSKPSNSLKCFGRHVERSTRRLMRGPLQSALGMFRSQTSQIDFQCGDALIISGSTWDSFDPKWLRKIVCEQGVKLMCVLSDMIPWKFPHQFHDSAVVEKFVEFAEVLARHASLVACISRATQADFQDFAQTLKQTRNNSEVILLGADLPNEVAQPKGAPDDLLTRGFILSVSTIQVRKNQQLLYQLWRRFAEEGRRNFPRLVLVGANGWLTEDLRKQLASDPLTKESILLLNNIGDAHLQWLYQNCRFTLYPSLYEGWGLPIVESLQHGKACIASNTSSMPEASQNLALHLDPLDFMSWHKWILRWTESSSTLSEFELTIRREFKLRSWNDFSQEFLRRILSQTELHQRSAA